ncbi:MAG TPA: RnfABCDGE type electron transport complex subunit D [Planctomycetota bacterium]|nr:RnfABCDGE type electron transport complex subunit D [Planctomycetota bacterium]
MPDPPAPARPSEARAAGARKPKKRFLKQPQMLRMVYALAPVAVVGIYFFGWRVLALLAVCAAAGVATEWLMASRRGAPLTTANFVTCALYTLSLPPTMPFWMAAVGIVVGVLFGKEVFGGFGRNWANPAIVGRAFVYVAFPIAMTGSFVPAFRGWPGGFGHWAFHTLAQAPEWLGAAAKSGLDAVTAATPVIALRDFGYETPLRDLVLGSIGGTFHSGAADKVLAAGSIGETCAPLIILAGIYLLVTKTANWRLMLSPLLAASAMVALLHHVLGVARVPSLPFSLLSSSLLYGCVFMVTEPVSAPRKPLAMWLYGCFIGVTIITLRWQGQFAGSVSFSILLGNTVGPSFDMAVNAWQQRKKAARAEA